MDLRQYPEHEDDPRIAYSSQPRSPISVAGIQSAASTDISAAESLSAQSNVKRFANAVLRKTQSGRNGSASRAENLVPLLGVLLAGSLLSGQLVLAPFCLLVIVALLMFVHFDDAAALSRATRWDYSLGSSALPVLCKALDWPDRRVRFVASRLLTQHLLNVRPADNDILDKEARHCLYRRLSPRGGSSDRNLTIAVLRSLPVIGTHTALPYVRRLATHRAYTRGARRVRDAALATLPMLEERVAAHSAAEKVRAEENGEREAGIGSELTESERETRAKAASDLDEQMRAFEAERSKVSNPGLRYGFLVASWLTIVPYTAMQAHTQFTTGNWPAGLLFGALTILATQLYRLTLTDKHKLLARQLGTMDDVQCIGRLAEMLDWPDRNVRKLARLALTRLLPRVSASDGLLLTPGQLASLHRMLLLSNANAHAQLLVGILKALEQTGDASSIPFVERLSNEQPDSQRQRMVCDAAADCLPYLMTRSDLNRTSQTLLRASSLTGMSTDSLLRPAHHTGGLGEDELLRPQPTSDGKEERDQRD